MKRSLIFTFFLMGSVFSYAQVVITHGDQEVFNNTVTINNTLTVDSIKVKNGLNTVHLRADSVGVNNGIKTKNLTVDNAKINNSLTVNNLTATNFNFSNALNLTGGDLRVGDFASLNNTNFVLRYKNQANIGALFAFFKGDGISDASITRDAYLSKISGAPFIISTDAAESIEFNTANTKRLTIGGTGNVGIGAEPTTERLNVDGRLRVTGNASIGSNTTTDSLTVNGKLRMMGNVGIGTSSTIEDRLTVDGSLKITSLGEPELKLEGNNPRLRLNGDVNTVDPSIHFSGDDGTGTGTFKKDYTILSGQSGGFTIKTHGRLSSQVLGTTANTTHKQLHVYYAQNWSGYAEIGAKALYSPSNFYANAIDFTASTRIRIEPNQYTGGLLMSYSDNAPPQLGNNYIAAAIKSQYVGTLIGSAGQHKFDMVFGINSNGSGDFSYDPVERMRIKDNGIVNVGKAITINTNLLPTTGNYRLAVGGDIIAEKVVITTLPNWPDYVFAKNYKLTPLSKVEKFIEKNGHLPNLPSAEQVKKDGIEVGTMNAKLLEKIEELTLYIINQQKQIDELKKEVKNMKK